MICEVTQADMLIAAAVHSVCWRKSHKDICSDEFIGIHTPEYQKKYLEAALSKGARLYMLIENKPVGIVSVRGGLIENLYVLPDEQNKGYGTKLLKFAIEKCTETPTLWILSTNDGAKRLYERNGFVETGKIKQLTENLYELELRFAR